MEPASVAAAVVAGMASGLGHPENIIGGLVVGWFCRRWWQVVLAAVAMHAAVLAVFMPGSLPVGAQIAWLLAAFGVIPPLAWCAAGFLLRRHVVTPGGTGERLGTALAAAVLGGIAGAVVGATLGTFYVELARVSQMEGTAGYVVVFLFVLPGMLIGSVIAGIVAWRRLGQ